MVFYQTRMNIPTGISFWVRIKTLPPPVDVLPVEGGPPDSCGHKIGLSVRALDEAGSRQPTTQAICGLWKETTFNRRTFQDAVPLQVRAAEYGPGGTDLSSVPPGDAGTGRLAWEIRRPSCSGGWRYGSALQSSGTESWTSSG